jgi:hypothetical protein
LKRVNLLDLSAFKICKNQWTLQQSLFLDASASRNYAVHLYLARQKQLGQC